jgi:O-antigen ligase
MADHSLRSPHNAHMTVLARMGAPGFGLWILLQLTWAAGIVRSYLHSRRRSDVRWQGVFFFLGTFWLAFLINASFDVFLEGPMGGIWFWTVFGVGAAAVWIYERAPEAMYPGYEVAGC